MNVIIEFSSLDSDESSGVSSFSSLVSGASVPPSEFRPSSWLLPSPSFSVVSSVTVTISRTCETISSLSCKSSGLEVVF